MEIRVLRYFLTIAREETITGAANLLHMTQPTLSRQIKELEKELGQQLLVRGNHRVRLTPEGMLLRKRAEEIISMVDKTEAEFTSLEDTVSDNSEDVTERLDKGLLDFGILIQPADISKYDYIGIPAKDVWGVIMRKDSPLAEKPFITKEDLQHLPLICSRQAMQHGRTGAFAEWFGEDLDKADVVTTFNLVYNASIMVDAGIGYAIAIDNLIDTAEVSGTAAGNFRQGIYLRFSWKNSAIFSNGMISVRS